MKTLLLTLEKEDIVATILEHEKEDEKAKNDIIERCKDCNIIMKIDINGFAYMQYKKV